MNTKTFVVTPKTIKRDWHLINLEDQILGRVSTEICDLLTGKNKPYFTPAMDCGDYVVAINAGKIKTTANKITTKLYRWHSGFPGGFHERSLSEMNPVKVIELAVTGMLPKNKLRTPRLRRLKVFVESKHPYSDKLTVKTNG